MATLMVYKWLSPLPSRRRRRGVVSVPVQEEMLTDQLIYAPQPLWYTSGERAEEHLQVRRYLHDVIWSVRAATQDFSHSLRYSASCQELAMSVCEALLVIDSVQIRLPKCLMCKSPVAVREIRRGPAAGGENMLHYTVSGGPTDGPTGARPWILDEIMVYPSWRVDSPPRLCAVHSHEYHCALVSVSYGCVRLPVRSLYAAAEYDSSRPCPSDPEAQVGPSS